MEYIGRLQFDKKLLENSDKIVIFGAGNGLKELLVNLEKLGVMDRIICICDNDPNKQGKMIEGMEITDLDDTSGKYMDVIYLVYNQFCVEICKQLVEKKIDRIHLIRG